MVPDAVMLRRFLGPKQAIRVFSLGGTNNGKTTRLPSPGNHRRDKDHNKFN